CRLLHRNYARIECGTRGLLHDTATSRLSKTLKAHSAAHDPPGPRAAGYPTRQTGALRKIQCGRMAEKQGASSQERKEGPNLDIVGALRELEAHGENGATCRLFVSERGEPLSFEGVE